MTLLNVTLKNPRVNIVINNNPIEKVSDFPCLGYLILDYKNYLEDKLPKETLARAAVNLETERTKGSNP